MSKFDETLLVERACKKCNYHGSCQKFEYYCPAFKMLKEFIFMHQPISHFLSMFIHEGEK